MHVYIHPYQYAQKYISIHIYIRICLTFPEHHDYNQLFNSTFKKLHFKTIINPII